MSEEREPTVREIIAELRDALDYTRIESEVEAKRLLRIINKLEFAYNTEELEAEARYTLTDLGEAYRRAMASGAKLNGAVKAGEK